jgi:hypothetical protein
MQIHSPKRRASIVTAIAVLFLAFAVLGWGTGYKMSLYHGDGNSASAVPAAKLLSQKERPASTQVVESLLAAPANHQPSTYPAILTIVLMFGLPLILLGATPEFDELDDSRKQLFAHTSFFSFRPPPVFLLSN